MSDAPTPDLLFADPPPAGGDLLFGASSAPSPSVVRATLAVGLPLLQLAENTLASID
jgi:hypothetical protein